MPKTIFAQDNKAEAETRWDAVADALREKQPKLGATMDASREAALADMGLRAFLPHSIHRMDCRLRRTGANSQGNTGRRSPARIPSSA